MERHLRSVGYAAWWLVATIGFGCQSGAGGHEPKLRPASVWSPYLRGPSPSVADPTLYRGTLFALRVDEAAVGDAIWIGCPLEVPYRYEAIAPRTETVDIGDVDTLARFAPLAFEDLGPFIEAGQPVRVEYEVVGRFVVDSASQRAASVVCPAATHYVHTIAVGAYRSVVGFDPAAGKAGSVALAGVRSDTRGRPASCRASRSAVPLSGCTVPVAYDLLPIPGHDPNSKMRLSETAKPDQVPSSETMPGATERRAGPSVSAGFDDCFAGFKTTGDAERDLRVLTDRCGGPTGMVPHSEVLAGWQAATADVSRYTVVLEAGQCYRAFGVGGEGVRDLDMGWHDPASRILARDVRPDGWAVVSPEGPMCVHESGQYELIVSVEAGQGAFAVQVWRVDR